jgi:hypothetical protein
MKIRITPRQIAAFVGAIFALTAFVGVAQAANSKPAGMSNAEYRAVMIRSEALNERYGLGESKGGVPQGMTAAEYRSMRLHGEALNKKYGLGRWSKAAATTTSAPTPTISSGGFAWGAFGIGAVAMLGLVLLAAGVLAGSRYTREAPRVRTS